MKKSNGDTVFHNLQILANFFLFLSYRVIEQHNLKYNMVIDNLLLKKCIKGDEKNQEALFKKLYSPIYKTCLLFSSCDDEAKEFLQLGFIKIFNSISSFKGLESFQAWSTRIVRNNIINELRRRNSLKYEEIRLSGLEEADEETNEELEFISGKTTQDVIKAVQNLIPSYKIVFNMRVFDQLTHEEIATELNIPLGTSKSNYHRAKIKVKEFLYEI